MKKRILTIVSLSVMINLIVGSVYVSASESDVNVSYSYDQIIQTENPDYVISIPAGIVFSSVNPGVNIQIDVEMITPEDGQSIAVGSKADVSVSSKKGYFVSLDTEGKEDPVEYQLRYENSLLQGKGVSQKIGTLVKTNNPEDDTLVLKGSGYIKGVATKTGNHTDVLTYTVVDTTNQ